MDIPCASSTFMVHLFIMKRLFFTLYLTGCLFSMQAQNTTNANFQQYTKGFFERFWKMNPDWASSIGYHRHDSILIIPNDAQRAKEIAFYEKEWKKLQAFPLKQLSDANRTDHQMLTNELQKYLWQLKTLREYEWNPAYFNVGSTFAYIITENYAPLKKRMEAVFHRLKKVPDYYAAAKASIQHPSKEHLQLAIDQNEGTLAVFEKDYVDAVKALRLYPESEELYLKRGEMAAKAVKDYITFLKNYPTDSLRSFRLGAELYADKFRYDIQSQYSADEIYQAALERKSYLHREMYALSAQLWPKYFGSLPMPADSLSAIKKVIDTLSAKHVAQENFKTEIEKQIPALTAFVKEKNLIYLDPNKPLKVRDEPGYMAGVAGASISSPGPYEKNGNTYYNVGTLDGWPADKAESYLREYNHYVLQILNIHEAIPGHYVQLVYSNKSPSLVKSVFGNGAMVEGWAVFSELMMLENGYGNNEPEMWLMYYKWNLRTTCNTILDIGVHTKNMPEADAMDLLVRQAFQQAAEASGKWRRVQVTNVQLCSYFTGFYEILQLREAYKKKYGSKYSVKQFNEQLLQYGSAPVKHISELLLSGK